MSFFLLIGCSKSEPQSLRGLPVSAGENAKAETAVVYMKSNVPSKFDLDAVFMENRELIYFKAGGIPFVSSPSISVLDDPEKDFDQGKLPQRFDVLVNRADGVLCYKDRCVNIVMICPSKNNSKKEEVCKYFN
ncbi:hypothetical protein [Paracidovorax oryzae]|uniref:hypothetical protein n=1 Tax=Paracidovorax oryzae TaxID=862720 RepID=UPI0035D13793